MYTTKYQPPTADSSQDLTWNMTKFSNGTYHFVVLRPLAPKDKNNFAIKLKEEFPMLWAEQTTTADLVQHNDLDNSLKLTLTDDGGSDSGSSFDFVLLHGFGMWFLWSVFGFLLLCSNRWYAYASDKMQYVHSITGFIMLLMTLTFVILVSRQVGWVLTAAVHTIFGWLLLLSTVLAIFGGIATYRIKNTVEWNTKQIMLMRRVHGWAGRVVFLSAYIPCTLGILLYCKNHDDAKSLSFLAYINIAFGLLFMIGNEFRYQRMLNQLDEFDVKQYPVITETEFEERVKKGENLSILDNLVLDLTNYAHQHPGGAFLIKYTAGRDISKFFYGGYGLDGNNNSPKEAHPINAHSNVARKIANKHVVAVIGSKKVQENKFKIDQGESRNINPSTKSLSFKLTSNQKDTQVGDSGTSLLGKANGLQSYYPELQTLGKHFTFCSHGMTGNELVRNGIKVLKRHYTITNCLREPFYRAVIQQVMNNLKQTSQQSHGSINEDFEWNPNLLNAEETSTVNVTIKNYKIEQGLSKRIHDKEQKLETFEIKGPMGRGLGLTQNSKGTYYAFSAGTGVLVFIDLVARIALSELDLIPNDQKMHKDFKLILFASFLSKEEAIALELLQALS